VTALQTPAPDAPAEEWGRLAMRIPGWCEPAGDLPSSWLASFHDLVPDPDHWAWEGWFLRLLGPGWLCYRRERDGGWCLDHPPMGFSVDQPTLGRACIAAAVLMKKWSGGEG
jgi:hypothetical protein